MLSMVPPQNGSFLTKKLHITTHILYYAVCRNSMSIKGDPVSVITTVLSLLKAI